MLGHRRTDEDEPGVVADIAFIRAEFRSVEHHDVRSRTLRAGKHQTIDAGREAVLEVLGEYLGGHVVDVLLAVELLLNSANIALVAFSRYWDVTDGQVFALIVMVVAATEVVIGLGLVVAVYRQRLALDVDHLSSLKG